MRHRREVPLKHIDFSEELDEDEALDYTEEDIENRLIKDWEEASGLNHPQKQPNARKNNNTKSTSRKV